jgi:hypothetical protein
VGDFHIVLPGAGTFLIECKNVREWLYPNAAEIKDAIVKPKFALRTAENASCFMALG